VKGCKWTPYYINGSKSQKSSQFLLFHDYTKAGNPALVYTKPLQLGGSIAGIALGPGGFKFSIVTNKVEYTSLLFCSGLFKNGINTEMLPKKQQKRLI
jgi:hypothetical protein